MALVGSAFALMVWGGSAGASDGSCAFAATPWHLDGRAGKDYYMTVVKGVSCAEAITLARPLTGMRLSAADERLPAPSGWVCQSFTQSLATVAIGGCVKQAKAVSWAPRIGVQAGEDLSLKPAQPARTAPAPGTSSSPTRAASGPADTVPAGGGMSTLLIVAIAVGCLGALTLAVVTPRPHSRATFGGLAPARLEEEALSRLIGVGDHREHTGAESAAEMAKARRVDATGWPALREVGTADDHRPAQQREAEAKTAARRARRDDGRRGAEDATTVDSDGWSHPDVDSRAAAILTTAEETARGVLAAAQAEAEKVRSEAHLEADLRMREARERAERIAAEAAEEMGALDDVSLKTRQAAEETARAIVAAAHAEAERVRNEAEEDADLRVRDAREQAAHITAEAEKVRDEAEEDADQRMRDAQERAARIVAEAERMLDEAEEDADERMREAEQRAALIMATAAEEIGALDRTRSDTHETAEETARSIVAAAHAEAERVRSEAEADAERRMREAQESVERIAAEAAEEIRALDTASSGNGRVDPEPARVDDERLPHILITEDPFDGAAAEHAGSNGFPRGRLDSTDEERYLDTVVNSPAMTRWLALFQPKLLELLESRGLNPRDLDQAGWRLPVPAFDPANEAHTKLIRLGKRAEAVASEIRASDINGHDPERLIRDALESSGVTREIDSIVIGLLLR